MLSYLIVQDCGFFLTQLDYFHYQYGKSMFKTLTGSWAQGQKYLKEGWLSL